MNLYYKVRNLKFTIITSTFNCSKTINKTVKSIRRQIENGSDVQWIIVDGLSTDSTLEVLNENIDIIDKLIVESDEGIYDAWNKAVKNINGDWVIFMGSGDTFNSNSTLVEVENFLKFIDATEFKIVYGNVSLVDADNNSLDIYEEIKSNDYSNGRPPLPPHQGTFQHKDLFCDEKTFDDSYKIAADSKFLFLALRNTKIKYIPLMISNMEIMGVSTNPKLILRTKKEIDKLRKDISLIIPKYSIFIFNVKCYAKHLFYNYFPLSCANSLANFYRKLTGRTGIY